jgi:hypothetical protein
MCYNNGRNRAAELTHAFFLAPTCVAPQPLASTVAALAAGKGR